MVDLLAELVNNLDKFSKGKKLIANFIINEYERAAFMTAFKLAKEVGVSESTVVRFATEIGFEGYPQLQGEIQNLIRNKLNTLQRMEVATSKLENSDILTTVLNSDIDKIKSTLIDLNREDFNNAVQLILNAKVIYILGSRSSSTLANFLGFYFNLLFDNVKLINSTSASEVFEQLLRVEKDDVVIGISYPRYSKRTVKAMQYCSHKKANIIAITDSKVSPVAKSATTTLIAYSDMTSFVDSLVAPLSLINALVAATAIRKKEQLTEVLLDLENVWAEYDVYEKIEGDMNE